MHRFAPAFLAAVALTWSIPASADTLVPNRSDFGKISKIGKGIKEIGVDSLLIVKSRSLTLPDDSETSNFGATLNVGPVFRYFLADNFAVSTNIGLLVNSESASATAADGTVTAETSLTSFGVLGTVMADYYLRLAGNVFLKPGVGAGGFWTQANEDNGNNTKTTHTTAGGVGRLQAGIVYFTSPKFNIRAGADVIMLFGSRSTEGVEESTSVFQLDVGWNVGFGLFF